jgi:hypothetical protein
MFAYNPTVSNNAGQIYGQFQLQGAQAFDQGIGQAATGISDAIKQANLYNLQAQQARGTLNIANSLGLIDDTYKDLPAAQQIGAAANISPLLNAMAARQAAAAMGSYRMAMLGLNQQKADNARMGKTMGIMPWNSTPAPGGLGTSVPDDGSSAPSDSAQ